MFAMGQGTSQTSSQFSPDTEVFIHPGLGGDLKGTDFNQRRRFRHPMAAVFHMLFKSLALLFYLFGGLFGQDFISTFVAVILLISMDFWVVKNVTGRLLAGLRWSNYIDDEGNSHWIFENKNIAASQAAEDRMSGFQDGLNDSDTTADSSIFWTGLIIAPTIWVLLMFISIFKLNVQWFMLVILASILSLSNLYGYVRCRLGTSDIKSSMTQFIAKRVFLNFFTGTSSSNKPA